jgi:hypothetical protein
MANAGTKAPVDDLEMSISEDELIRDLMEAQGKEVELIAFGIAYSGTLAKVDAQSGYATVVDGDNQATLEFERIESFRMLK